MQFKTLIALSTICLISCNSLKSTEKKTFLDYDFGMSYDEYYKHSMQLFYDKKINLVNGLGSSAMGLIFTPNLNGGNSANLIEYKLIMPNDRGTTYTFIGHVRGDVNQSYSSTLLTSIEYEFKWEIGGNLNLFGYKQVQKVLILKYGNTFSEDSIIEAGGKMFRTNWVNENSGFSFTVDERSEFKKAEFFYYVKGVLEEQVKRKESLLKSSKHDINNKY